jgi:hypothetical protein
VIVAVRPEPVGDLVVATSSASVSSCTASPSVARSERRAASARVLRAVLPSATSSIGGSSMRWSIWLFSRCCSLGSQDRYGLGTPRAEIARETLPKMSYWEFASPKPASSCGCVVITWKDSMKASCATFQFTRSTFDTCTRV